VRPPDELSVLFRARGLKVTPQRQCIFRVLHGNDGHPTAETVYQEAARQLPTLSLKTVYQTLHELADLGQVGLLDLGTGATRVDPDRDRPHHHLICERCGKVRDVVVDLQALAIPEVDRGGFVIGATEIVFRGRCDACAEAATFPHD
jgi:Fur family transcriptional regulator, stress-responsive regulator